MNNATKYKECSVMINLCMGVEKLEKYCIENKLDYEYRYNTRKQYNSHKFIAYGTAKEMKEFTKWAFGRD